MNVGQLTEALGDYGDHLEVQVEIDKGERSQFVGNITVDARTGDGDEPIVTLTVEV